jgi:transposase
MSLRPHALEPGPEETARVARAAFPKGNPYLTLRDALGTIFQDDDFTDLYSHEGQPGLSAWRLALVTLMQFRKTRSDRQAAESVRARIDWKYLLSLDLTDPGCDFSVLSAFRDRLLAGSAVERWLDKLLERCRAMGWLKARGQQRTDSTHVLAAMRVLNRLELVAETLRAALNAVAPVAPAWLQTLSPLAWYDRYGRRMEDARLPKDPAEREASAQTVGEDGFHCLDALETPEAPQAARELPLLATLRRTWQRHYDRTVDETVGAGEAPHIASASRRIVHCHRRPRPSKRRTMPTRGPATNGTRSGPGPWSTSAKRASLRRHTCSPMCLRPPRPSMKPWVRTLSSRRASRKTCPRMSILSMRPLSAPSCSSKAVRPTALCCEAP